jgi:phosphoglycolate phosphatase-like HAD superfamily hydrolase
VTDGNSTLLPSWRAGATRDAIIAFLDAAEALPVTARVAAFDNDGTLWCEKPTYLQFDFFEDALRTAAEADADLRDRPEFAAVLDVDVAAIGELGPERVALALAGLFAGLEPEEFTARARGFMHRARHRTLGLPALGTVYQPMLELLDELRRRAFTIFIVSGGGTEFVRSISEEVYGIAPEAVVGTLIEYEFDRLPDGRPVLRRTARVRGLADEGAQKVSNIQTQLGRRPILSVGNSGGDREMLEFACAGDIPGLALLIDHDDAEREFQYVSVAGTFIEPEPITDVARKLGWTVVSMASDWHLVFAAAVNPP